ncbi:hypothetical protein J4407_00590 [Candidatus Pacearchaeota archaeon]|nr:hypothetical protein [Candidatus Pacearchaeota archaeon]
MPKKKIISDKTISKIPQRKIPSVPVKRINPLQGNLRGYNKDAEKVLIENFVALQKVMTNLSLKFDELTIQISKLLELFEISAKSLAERRDFGMGDGRAHRELSGKLDNLMEQNKTLARGLSLLHEPRQMMPQPSQMQQPMRNPPPQNINRPSRFNPLPQKQAVETDDYKKSISPEEKEE